MMHYSQNVALSGVLYFTFGDVHHIREHVPDDIEHAQHEEKAEALDAGGGLLVHLIRAWGHGGDLTGLLLHLDTCTEGNGFTRFFVRPARVLAKRMIGPQVSAIVDADVVAGRMGVEEPLAPMTAITPRMHEARAFTDAWVISYPEEEDGLQPEHTTRVVQGLGVVDNPEARSLTPQALIHEDGHKTIQTRRIPTHSRSVRCEGVEQRMF